MTDERIVFSSEECDWETITILGQPVPRSLSGLKFTVTRIHFGRDERDIRTQKFVDCCWEGEGGHRSDLTQSG